MDEAQYQKGVEQFAQMVGREKIDALREKFQALSPDFERLVMGTIGGEVWNRPDITRRQRMVCSVAAFTAIDAESQSRKFFRSALNVGLTKGEIVEIIMQTGPYSGFPRALNALVLTDEVLD